MLPLEKEEEMYMYNLHIFGDNSYRDIFFYIFACAFMLEEVMVIEKVSDNITHGGYFTFTVYQYIFSIFFYVNFMFCFYYRISARCSECKKLIKIKDNKTVQFVCDNCTSTSRIS